MAAKDFRKMPERAVFKGLSAPAHKLKPELGKGK